MTSARIRLLTVPRDRLWQDERMSHRTLEAARRQAGKGLGSVCEQKQIRPSGNINGRSVLRSALTNIKNCVLRILSRTKNQGKPTFRKY